ncbi:MAG TPA: dynamin family protein, partial [Myxococcaceae bacterium]
MATNPSRASGLQPQRFEQLMQQVGNLLESFGGILEGACTLDPKNRALDHLQEMLSETRRKWSAQRFQVAVLALVKSGKSTLINSWLGQEYLPAANTPETSRIVRVRHAQVSKGVLRSNGKVLKRGAAETNRYLRLLNEKGRQVEGSLEEDLVLEAPLVALKGRPLGQQAFEILDTPGPNEAGTPRLQQKVEQVLSEADVIVYVLDYTKLKTAEESSLFTLLEEMRPELLRRCSERLFFIVNKIDMENRNGLSPDETAAYVTKLLRGQFPSLKLTQDRIIPVAAERALLARMVAQGRPSQESLKDFRQIVFGLAMEEATLKECQARAPVLLANSRVAELEKEILAFIYEHRGRLMLQSFLDDLSRYCHQLHNHLVTVSATLKEDHAKLSQRKKELEVDLAKVTV